MLQATALADPLLTTKLYAPPPRDCVRRTMLIERLEAGVRGPLTLVVAPAGSGKTTLLSAWCAGRLESGSSVAWLALDAGDDDLARFLRYLVAALRSISAAVGDGVLALIQAPPLPAVEALMTPLVNDLAACAGEMILVLDDYHVLEAAAIHQAVAFLLEHLPPQMHLVLASRTDPPLPLARLRARGQLMELRAADLRFTQDEAADFLGRVMGLRLSANEVAALEARTEGWVAGLQLAALSVRSIQAEPATRERGDADVAGFIAAFTGSHRYIVDYLGDEVLSRQPEGVQQFLLRTSILDCLCAELCDAVSGRDDSRALLERLERANLFVIALDEERRLYRYHHLFADFLRQRLRQAHAGDVRDLHLRAAAWYEREGLMRAAIEHALAAASFDQAARLIEQLARPLMWQWSEVKTLRGWLERLPHDVIQSRPRLYLDETWSRVWSGNIADIVARLRETERILGAGTTTPSQTWPHAPLALQGELALLRSTIAYFQGNAAETIARAQQALACLPEEDGQSRSLALAELGLGHRMRNAITEASEAHVEGAQVAERSGQLVLALACLGYLVHDHHLAGRLREAERTYRHTLALADSWRLSTSAILRLANIYMGDVLRERDELDTAECLLLQGIEHIGQIGGHVEDHVNGYLSLIRLRHARGDDDGARQALDQVERRSAGISFAPRVALAGALLALGQGDLQEAARMLAAAGADVRCDIEISGERLGAGLMVARFLVARGKGDDGLRLLQRLLLLAEAGGCGNGVIEVLVLQALGYHAAGKSADAMSALSRVLTVAEPEGYVRTFVDEGAPMAALLREARRRGIATEYVGRLFAAFGETATAVSAAGAAARPGQQGQPLPEPLSERELEILRLLASGLSTTEIADKLVIAVGTVKNHLKHIFGKLDAHSRLQSVERARTLHLL